MATAPRICKKRRYACAGSFVAVTVGRAFCGCFSVGVFAFILELASRPPMTVRELVAAAHGGTPKEAARGA